MIQSPLDQKAKENVSYYIEGIKHLPHSIVKNRGILPEELEGNQKYVFGKVQKLYEAIAYWLEFYVLNKKKNPSQCYVNTINSKPHAEITLSRLKLVQEMFLKIHVLQEHFSTPYDFWWFIEWENCELGLSKIGLLDEPVIVGKERSARDHLKKLKKYEEEPVVSTIKFINSIKGSDYGWQEVSRDKIKQLPSETDIERQHRLVYSKYLQENKKFLKEDISTVKVARIQLVKQNPKTKYIDGMYRFAAELAGKDIHFKRGAFTEFTKINRRCTRQIKDDPNLKSMYIKKDGELLIQDKHIRGKDRQKRKRKVSTNKGFGKSK